MPGYKPVTYRAPEGSEIAGGVIESFLEHLDQDVIDRFKFNRSAFDRSHWYPYQLFLDMARDVTARGGSGVETAIGKSLGQDITRLFAITDLKYFIERGLTNTANIAFRNVPDGFGYVTTKLGYDHYHIKIQVPSPDYMVYGYVWEVSRQLCPKGVHFSLIVDREFGEGSKPGSFTIKWGPKVYVMNSSGADKGEDAT
ncbi:MAG: hypothetical protein AAFU54_22865 [Chloroflexota bacterium]